MKGIPHFVSVLETFWAFVSFSRKSVDVDIETKSGYLSHKDHVYGQRSTSKAI